MAVVPQFPNLRDCLLDDLYQIAGRITLSSLWIRLSLRRDFDCVLDDFTKQYLWTFIRQHKNLQFFIIPEQRSDVSPLLTENDNSSDPYPIHLITKGWGQKDDPGTRVWGSCQHYEKRRDISSLVKTDPVYESLEVIIKEFKNSFVIVASTELRMKSLIGPSMDVATFSKQNVFSPLQYACLERIGRSRFKGETSLGKTNLHGVFKMRPKDMFYVLGLLERIGVIKRETYSVMVTSKLRYGSVSVLSRYYSTSEPNFYFTKMKQFVAFLDKRPDRKATIKESKLALGVEHKCLKKIVDHFSDVINRVVLNDPNPRYLDYVEIQAKNSSANLKDGDLFEDDESSDEDSFFIPGVVDGGVASTSQSSPYKKRSKRPLVPKETISTVYLQLNDKIEFNEETGEWKKIDEDAEAKDSDNDEEFHQVDWLQQNPYRTKLYELLRVIREAKSDGVVANDLRKKLALSRKQADRILENVKKTNLIKTVTLSVGKVKKRLYVWACEQHESSIEFDKFTKFTGINLDTLSSRERDTLGERNIHRMNIILSHLEESSKIIQKFEMLKLIKATEKEEGYKFEMDRKCLDWFLEFLASYGALKLCGTVLVDGNRQRTLNFICHRSIEPSTDASLFLIIENSQKAFENSKRRSNLFTPANAESETMDFQMNETVSNLHKTADHPEENLHKPSKPRKRKPEFISHAAHRKRAKLSASGAKDGVGETTSSSHVKRKSAKDIEMDAKINSIMTYVSNQQDSYGLQGKLVQAQLLHEFLTYWLTMYEGKLVERSTLSKNQEDREPDVYLDEDSWRRHIPPPPVNETSDSRWFLLSEAASVMPIALVCMICNCPCEIEGLDEILAHPKKRWYLFSQIPEIVQLALQVKRRMSISLTKNCILLCSLGLLSLGPVSGTHGFLRSDSNFYYLHKGTKLLDTSTTPYRFYVIASPMSRYRDYDYEFNEWKDIEKYWLHFRAICFSSRMGHRNLRNADDETLLTSMKNSRISIPSLCGIKRIFFDQVSLIGAPAEPRLGAGGYHAALMTFRVRNWKLNRHEIANWFIAETRRRMVLYEKEIVKTVDSLSLSWNYLINMESLQQLNNTLRHYVNGYKRVSTVAKRNGYIQRNVKMNEEDVPRMKRIASINSKSKSPFLNHTDKLSYVNKRTLRGRFSLRESQTMILARAISALVTPHQKFWVNADVVRDLMHKHVPESRNKVSKSMLQHSARELYYSPASYDSMIMMKNQLKLNEDIKSIRKRYPLLSFCSPQQKGQMFTELFEKALEIFSSGSNVLENDNENLEKSLENYVIVKERTGDTEVAKNRDVSTFDDIREATVFNFYLSMISLSRRDGSFSAQLNEINKQLPSHMLTSVLYQLKRDGLIVNVLPHRVMAKHVRSGLSTFDNALGSSSGSVRRHLTFSYYYRHFFYHKFHMNLMDDAVRFCELLSNRPDEFHNVLMESPGLVPVLVSLIYDDKAEIRLKLPDLIVAFPPEVQNEILTKSSAAAAANDDIAKPHSDSDSDLPRVYPLVPIRETVKPVVGHAVKINKSMLYQLRYERLKAVESKERTFNMRLNNFGLNPSEICVKSNKPAASSLSSLDELLMTKIPVEECHVTWREFKDQLMDDDCKVSDIIRIYEIVASGDVLGVTEDELRKSCSDIVEFDVALKQLLYAYQIVKVGHVTFRYVTYEHRAPWVVTSFVLPGHLQSVDDNLEVINANAEPVQFVPRPWIQPDGMITRPMLKWLCEGILLRVLSFAGITESEICNQFGSVLQPTSVITILNYLYEIGCLRKSINIVAQRQPTLFGWKILPSVSVTSYYVNIDGITKLETLFLNISSPDFISVCSSGDESKVQGNVFSRRSL